MSKAKTIRSLSGLISEELISPDPAEKKALEKVAQRFQVALTPTVIQQIKSPEDAIGRQFIPSSEELNIKKEELADPIGDEPHSPVKGLIHRYPDRVLLKPLHTCAVYCRFCFRREKVGTPESLSIDEAQKALDYIRNNKNIWEVIFSGGDPFLLSDEKLSFYLNELKKIDHVEVIRFHTRIPVVKPERINKSLIDNLKACGKAVFVVLHCNHADEFNTENKAACARLIDNGIPMLSQSVLLRGINDSAEELEKLMRRFVSLRIKPYYLHHGDLAAGTSHFRTSLDEGQEIMKELRGNLSGIAQPLYVIDIPGGYGKVPALPIYLHKKENRWHIEDWQSGTHDYCDEIH